MPRRLRFGLTLSAIVLGAVTACAPTISVPDAADRGAAASADAGAQQPDRDAAETLVDPELAVYKPVESLAGRITSVGSDTMNNLMSLWVEAFRGIYPQVEVEIEAKGSSTAIPALIAGAATFGPMSRDLTSKEIDQFEAQFGYKPTQLATSIDMLAVYVNKDNPLVGLSLPQVDAIFSKTRQLGYPKDIVVWGALGLEGDWATRPISLYGRNAASGTYGYFKDHVLGGGDLKDAVKEQPGSSSVVQGIGSDVGAIGYSGIGYQTADVRALPLADESGAAFVPPEPRQAYSGEYPLARFLWLTVNYRPGSPLDPVPREFIKFVLSQAGQQAVLKDGYLPLPAAKAREVLASVGIEATD